MTIQEVAERIILLQRLSDRTGVNYSATQGRLTRNLSAEQMTEVARLVLAQLSPLSESIPAVVKNAGVK